VAGPDLDPIEVRSKPSAAPPLHRRPTAASSTTPSLQAPPAVRTARTPLITRYTDGPARELGLHFDTYEALWQWPTTDLPAFWQSIFDHFDVQSPTPHTAVIQDVVMPGAKWFPGAQFNCAQQALRHADAAHAAESP